jgi:hypothetical protein
MQALGSVKDSKSTLSAVPAVGKNSDEYRFFQNFFDANFSIDLPLGTMKKVNDAFAQLMGKKSGSIESLLYPDRGFLLGQFVLLHVTTTHGIVVFIKNENVRAEILLERTRHLIDSLQIIFHAIYQKTMPAEFVEQVEQGLYLSTLLSFEEGAVKKYLHDYNLVGAYHNKVSLFGFAQTLAGNYTLFSQTLAVSSLSTEERKIALNECKTFYDGLVDRYKKNTVSSVSSNASLGMGLVCGAVAVIGSYFFDFSFFYSLLGAGVTGYVAEQLSREQLGKRKLSGDMQRSYLRSMEIHAQVAEPAEKAKAEALFKRVKPELLNQAKVAFSLWCHFKAVMSRRWQSTAFHTRSDQLFADEKAGQSSVVVPVYNLNSSDVEISPRAYQTAIDTYRKIKKPKKLKVEGLDDSDKKRDAEVSSYHKITYKLSDVLQQQGVLVIGGASKAFFNYGEHKLLMEGKIKSKLQAGIFVNGFGAKNGDFDCFKYEANLKRYELKFFDGTRIEFEERGHIKIADSGGGQHQIPCWQPVRDFKK